MKILIISDAWYPQVNGVVRTYENLMSALKDLGHSVEIISPRDFSFRVPMPGYSEIELALLPGGRLKKLIEAHNPDHIHIATEGPIGCSARRICVKTERSFSTSYHTQFPEYIAKRVAQFFPFLYNFTFEYLKKKIRGFHADAKVTMIATQSLEDELRSWGFQNPFHRLSRGVDLERFFPGEKTEFKDIQKPVALYVGRIAIEKNIEDFLSMPWEGSKVLVGDGPSRTELSVRYPEAIFTGIKSGDELAKIYRSADLFVFPSKTDTFGMVIIEALASGLPVAAFNVTGPKDIITEPFLGALTDHDLSAAALKALTCGSAEARAKHTQKTYRWDKVAKQFVNGITKEAQ